MKILFRLLKIRFISTIKNPIIMICILLCVFGTLFITKQYSDTFSTHETYNIACTNEDGSPLSEKLIEKITDSKHINLTLMPKDDAKRFVASGRYDGAFIILEEFTTQLKQGEFAHTIEFISPMITTSAYPISEVISAQVIDVWLQQIVKMELADAYKNAESPSITEKELNEIIDGYQDNSNEIVDIEQIDIKSNSIVLEEKATPFDYGLNIYATLIFFLVALSGGWIFSALSKGQSERLTSFNLKPAFACLASQLVVAIICLVCFIPALFYLNSLMEGQSAFTMARSMISMFFFLIGACGMTLFFANFVSNLAQFIIYETAIGIIHLCLSPIIVSASDNMFINKLSFILPSRFLVSSIYDTKSLILLITVSSIWILLSAFIITSRSRFSKANGGFS